MDPTPRDSSLVQPSTEGATASGVPKFGLLRPWPLLSALHRVGTARFRFRLLQGLTLSLAIDEVAFFWLAESASPSPGNATRMLASTIFWTFWLGIVAGWVLLAGWFEEPTRQLLGQLAQRRGYAAPVQRSLESLTSWRWLGMLLAFPSLACGLAAASRARSLSELAAVGSSVALALLFTQLITALVIGATLASRPLEVSSARRVWLMACVLPELLRLVMPGLPTLRSLARIIEAGLLRWGAFG